MLQTWNDIKDQNWDNLLLGNGFSTNIWNKYSYSSLYEYSTTNTIQPLLTENVKKIFSELATINFEEVLKALAFAILVKDAIGEETDELLGLYKNVQDNLFNTVYAVHVKFEELKIQKIGEELKYFKKIFTTCYDLIPYWSSFNTLPSTDICDFFWSANSSFDPEDTELYGNKSAFYYLHGALHLKQDLQGKVSKILTTAKCLPNKSDFDYAGNSTELPLYISEGKSEYKLKKIQSNSYLTFCYHSFSKMSGKLLVLGHSLDENYDNHLVEAIRNNKKLTKVAISIYSGLSETEKDRLKLKLSANLVRDGLELYFFESKTHPLINENVKVEVETETV